MRGTKCGFDDIDGGSAGADQLITWGPTLVVDIGFDPNHPFDAKIPPVPGLKGLNALVDTGATESCIDNLLAAQLNLPVVDKRTICGIHGAQEVNMYLAQVHVTTLNYTIHGAFAGVDLRAGGQPHSALIGRTFLQHFQMIYDGLTGTVELIYKGRTASHGTPQIAETKIE
jgi:predicted aspartyl protease